MREPRELQVTKIKLVHLLCACAADCACRVQAISAAHGLLESCCSVLTPQDGPAEYTAMAAQLAWCKQHARDGADAGDMSGDDVIATANLFTKVQAALLPSTVCAFCLFCMSACICATQTESCVRLRLCWH
jgi:hypothetical protein